MGKQPMEKHLSKKKCTSDVSENDRVRTTDIWLSIKEMRILGKNFRINFSTPLEINQNLQEFRD